MILERDTTDQDTRFQKAFAIIEKANVAHGFPGAVLAVGHQGKVVALKAFGKMTYAPDAAPVTPATIWDMASCTKVVATTTLAAMMIEQGMLKLDLPVRAYLPDFGTKDATRSEEQGHRSPAHDARFRPAGVQGVFPDKHKSRRDHGEGF